MSKRFKFLKVITIALCFMLVFTTLFFNAGGLYAQEAEEPGDAIAGEPEDFGVEALGDVSAMAATPWATAYNKLSDPDTSNTTTITQPFAVDVIENGRLWMDKSVYVDEAPVYDYTGAEVATVPVTAADEFLVTLSALSEAYALGATITPVDVVFIIDLSGSMTYGFTGDTEGTPNNRRVDALVSALNLAVKMLMAAHPENRVGLVAFGGAAGRIPMTYNILDLGHYTTTDGGDFFFVTTPSVNNADFNVRTTVTGISPAGSTIVPVRYTAPVSGGTPTQQGIYQGAQLLANNDYITYTDTVNDITVVRKPIMILMTDGEPTFGWTNYQNPYLAPANYIPGTNHASPPVVQLMQYEGGDALTPDQGIDILTVMTASYWKMKVQQKYTTTATGVIPAVTEFFTIGVYMENMHTKSVLDPANPPGNTNAMNNNQNYFGPGVVVSPDDTTTPSTSTNMATILNALTAAAGATQTFPMIKPIPYPDYYLSTDPAAWAALGYTEPMLPPRDVVTATNGTGVDYVSSYAYVDRYIQANNAGDLEDAFSSIATQITSQYSFITDISGNDPNFDGYLTFSDVLGEYMEVKSYIELWYDDLGSTTGSAPYTGYTGQQFATNIIAGSPTTPGDYTTGSAFWQAFTAALATQLGGDVRPVSQQEASDLVLSCIAAGTINAGGGNQITWYADAAKNYVGPYYNATGGTVSPVPTAAKCRMDLYPISAAVTSDVTGGATNLFDVCFVVLTALAGGQFTDADDKAMGITARTLVKDQQIVRLYVPAALIPMRTVNATITNNELVSANIIQTSPIRAIYSVGLRDDVKPVNDSSLTLNSLTLSGISNTYKQYYRTPRTGFGARYNFFTNQWQRPDANITNVFCEIDQGNPYYFYYNPSGRVPVYVEEPVGSGNYRIAVRGDRAPFYAKEEYYSQNATGYLVERYVPVLTNQVTNTAPNAPFIASGKERSTVLAANSQYNPIPAVGKEPNTTSTRSYVSQTNNMITSNNYKVQVRQLGNNGRFSIPVTQVNVRKVWYVSPRVPIDVEFWGQVGAAGTPTLLDTQTLSSANSWRYSWYPVANGGKELLAYSYFPDGSGDVDLINYSVQEVFPGGVQPDYPWSITGPTFNPNNNSWSIATITNGIRPNTPPPTTPPPGGGNNAETGDQTDLLSWWMMLFIALLGLCFIYKAGEYYRIKRRRAEERQ